MARGIAGANLPLRATREPAAGNSMALTLSMAMPSTTFFASPLPSTDA